MICSDGIDFLDIVAERRSVVRQQLQEFTRSRFPSQERELAIDGDTPGNKDSETNLCSESE